MKSTLIFYAGVLLLGCNASTDKKSDEAAITKLLDDETRFVAKSDSANWANCWVHSDDVSFMYTTADGVESVKGFKSIAPFIGQIEPFELKLKRDNYHFEIDNDIAFVQKVRSGQ